MNPVIQVYLRISHKCVEVQKYFIVKTSNNMMTTCIFTTCCVFEHIDYFIPKLNKINFMKLEIYYMRVQVLKQ